MMAANYRHIGGPENRLGRHYSRFSISWPPAPLAAQSLARRKSQNGGSNRRSQVREPVRCELVSDLLLGYRSDPGDQPARQITRGIDRCSTDHNETADNCRKK